MSISLSSKDGAIYPKHIKYDNNYKVMKVQEPTPTILFPHHSFIIDEICTSLSGKGVNNSVTKV